MTIQKLAIFLVWLFVVHPAAANVVLGPFDFDDTKFGNSLTHSDGGAFAARQWLNVVDIDPGTPDYLTGPDFDTGIANLGLFGPAPIYTIGYNTPIVNLPGDDLGVVVARFSTDSVTLAFSSDGGGTFSPNFVLPAASAVDTGVGKSYFFGSNSGMYPARFWVHPLDLSAFGFPLGSSVNAVRVTSVDELDIIRVAGFAQIPEPVSLVLVLGGFVVLISCRCPRATGFASARC